ncbi:MAG TPA: hypothetical protein VNK04_09170 [Gemmataceae bacterium]|jgi:hypothetical protein|nr:hypothetical protein [Gemmataceae bacterium]
MFLSRIRLLHGGGLAAVAALLLLARPAAAQDYPRIPPDAKGYQIVQIMQQNARQAQRPAATVVAVPRRGMPATYEVAVPSEPSLPRVVTLQAPDGTLRTFVLEGSIRTAEPRQVLVRLISK